MKIVIHKTGSPDRGEYADEIGTRLNLIPIREGSGVLTKHEIAEAESVEALAEARGLTKVESDPGRGRSRQ